MANQVIGTILTIGPTQELTSKSGNAFLRRELVVAVRRFDPYTGEPTTDTDNTPQLVFIGERCRDLDAYQPGQVVAVSFEVRGRKYVDQSGATKIITDISPYRIEPYQPRSYGQQPSPTPQATYAPQQAYGYAQPPANAAEYAQPQQSARIAEGGKREDPLPF